MTTTGFRSRVADRRITTQHAPLPGVVVPDVWACSATSRGVANYKAPVSPSTINVFDPATNTFADWTPQPAVSRAVPNYKAPVSPPVIPVYDPATNTFADWTPQPATSRAVPFYRAPPSTFWPVFDQPAVTFGTDWASVSQGYRPPFRYLASPSVVVNVWDPATNTFADWAPQPVTNRTSRYLGSPSRVIPAMFSPDVWAAVFGSRAVPLYGSVRSWSAATSDNTPDTWASTAMSRRVPFYGLERDVTILTADVPLVFGTEFAPPIVVSPRVAPQIARVAVFTFPWGASSFVAPDPGGGGFGAQMGAKFLDRYDGHYTGRYRPRYRSRLRKAK